MLATVYTRPVIRCHLNNGADVNAITFAFLEVDSKEVVVVVEGLKVNVLPRVLYPPGARKWIYCTKEKESQGIIHVTSSLLIT